MDSQFVQDCRALKVGESFHRSTVSFDDLFNLKYPSGEDQMIWFRFSITARIKDDVPMNVWNGTHPPDENTKQYKAHKGTKVRVWMVSRFGDVGVTDNLDDPHGYDQRIDPEQLVSWTITRTQE